VLEESPADEDDFDIGVLDELYGNGGAVRDDCGFEFGGKVAGNLNGSCASVYDDDLAGANHSGSGSADRFLLICGDI
jgi:hypothetical protein